MKTPTYISKQLFEEALKNYHQCENIRIISFSTKDAVAAGENYVADLFRTSIEYYNPIR